MSGTQSKNGKPLRVLMVCTVPTAASGIPMVMFNLLRGMDRAGLEIGYVSINEPEERFRRELEEMGVKVWVVPRKLSSPWTCVWKLTKIARHYDILHAHGNSATLLLEMLAAFLAGVKVRGAHSHNTTCTQKSIDRAARPLFYALCNFRLACGETAGKWLFGKRGFHVINNGVNTERFRFDSDSRQKIRDLLGLKDSFVIGHVGNFVEAKNHPFLIEVFAEVVKRMPEARLLLLGAGDGRDEVERMVEDKGLKGKVVFAGSVADTEKYMSAMDVVVMPSLFEGLPLTLVEEQASGLNVLVSDAVTTQADMTGLLKFKPLEDGAESWGEEVVRMLIGYKQEEREKNSACAIKRIRENRYDIRVVAEELKQIYISLR